MKKKIKRRLEILRFIWNQYRWKTLGLALTSLLNLLVQLSTIAFLLPIIEYMKLEGNIPINTGYWKYLNYFFSTINQDVNFQNILLACFGLMCIYQISNYIRLTYSAKIRAEFHYIFQEKIAQTIFYGNYSNVSKYQQSNILNMLLHQTNQSAYFIFALFEYLYAILQTLLYVIFLCLLSAHLTLLVSTYVIIQIIIVNWRTRVIRKLGNHLKTYSDAMAHHIQEYSSSIKFITVLNYQKQAIKTLSSACNSYKNTLISTEKQKVSIDVSQETMHMGLICIIMYFSYSIWKIPLSQILLFLFMLTRLIPSLKSYNNYNSTLNSYFAYFDKLRNFITSIPLKNNIKSKPNSIDTITLQNISFAYTPKTPVLTNISHVFKQNVITAITGESGAGKTTLIDIILGLREPDLGTIVYKNQQKTLSLSDISTFYLPQVPIVFAGTLRHYFTQLHPTPLTDDEIITSLKQVNLWKHFNSLNGLDTVIDEKGSNLSEGQKQRLCLCHVFLNSYSLVVLDEFTSAIDQQSKEIILTAIKKIKNAIIIFITHDKDTVECATDILNLSEVEIKNNEK